MTVSNVALATRSAADLLHDSSGVDPWSGVRKLVALARLQLDVDVVWASQFVGGREVVQVLSGDPTALQLGIAEGSALVEASGVRVPASLLSSAIPLPRGEAESRALPALRGVGPGSCIGTSLRVADDEPVGALCCLNADAALDLDERAWALLGQIAELIGVTRVLQAAGIQLAVDPRGT